MKKFLLRVLTFILLIGMTVVPVTAQAPDDNIPLSERNILEPIGLDARKAKFEQVDPDVVISSDKQTRYIVLFEGDSLVVNSGGVGKLNVNSIQSQNYLATLQINRDSIIVDVEKSIGRNVQVNHIYDVILNGVSVDLTPSEAAKLESLPGIRRVLMDTTEELDTDAGPTWLGADTIWDGTAVPDGIGNKGEGILAGIIDSGINFDHPSFSDTPTDGYTYTWAGDYLGVCAPGGDPAYATACNDKVVGAYTFTDDNPDDPITPEDSDGHGSHTASTVAGNAVELEYLGETVTISGMAPHAQIVAYDACYPSPEGGLCAGDDLLAAVQQAVTDGVDVINFSIGGGEDPYNDAVELAFLEAFGVGVVVSTSAGNEGPDAGSVGHRSPWVLTTAASTHNRKYTNQVNFSDPLYQGIATLAGEVPFASAVVASDVIYAGEDTDNELGCEAFPAGFFTGSIALIKRGTCNFSVKIINAADAGAAGVLIFTDDRAPVAMSAPGTTIPNAMLDISGAFALEIANWVAAQLDETVDISTVGYYVNDDYGDIMADFSSRGPNTTFEVLKPDVSAPGMEILAAVSDSTITPSGDAEYDLYQGTSMASPHDAGAAALLYAENPDWTPAMIKSALMLTGYDGLLKEDKTTPADLFDMGAGRIQLELAGLTGLVMDETYANMAAADPAAGGDVKTLNIASLYNTQCVGECTWTRTFTSVADVSATYTVVAPDWVTVDPTSFTIGAGGTQVITITADVSGLTADEWQFANIEFLTDDLHAGGSSTALLTAGFEEGDIPDTWAVYTETGQTPWLIDDGSDSAIDDIVAPYAGSYMAWHNDDDIDAPATSWLISPSIAVPITGSTALKFWEDNYFMSYAETLGHTLQVSTGSCDPSDAEFVLLQDYTISSSLTAWTERTVDLSVYAGQDVCLAWKYFGDWASEWFVDEISVSNSEPGSPISDVALPLTVLPTTGNLPEWVQFTTHRDAGGDTLTDLNAVEITDLTVDTYGFVKGTPIEIQLAPDPTNDDPYDDLNQVFYTLIPMADGAARAVAEITASTAPDVDLFWGFDYDFNGMPSEDELYESSTTPTAFEYLSEWGFPAPWYDVWVLVQNWRGSGAAEDDITLILGYVPYAPVDPATMTVIGPETNPAGVPFGLQVLWHGIDTEPGDRLYGLFDAYADAAYTVPIGLTEVDVVRTEDDVVKTADPQFAVPGDTVTFTIEVTNYGDEALNYTIEDVLPPGMTYVEDSLTGDAVYDPGTNTISWTGIVDAPGGRIYEISDSVSNPYCDTGFGGYVNLEAYGIFTDEDISGDTSAWGWGAGSIPFNFYGDNYSAIYVTDDGFAIFDPVNTWVPAPAPWTNQDIPDAELPNALAAILWQDMEVVYDEATNKGITSATAGDNYSIIEFDDVQLLGDSSSTYDFEIVYQHAVDDTPYYYEIVFAYDNITGILNGSTIGLENYDGTVASSYAYNDASFSNGHMVCFDYVLPTTNHTITFQATVDVDVTLGTVILNEVAHISDGLGVVEEIASAQVMINDRPLAVSDNLQTDEETPLPITLVATDVYPGTLTWNVTDPMYGTLSGTAPDLTYTPDMDYYGMDSFTFTASDGFLESEVATISIEVLNINDTPIAEDDTYETPQDTLLEVAAPGVLENDSDADPTDAIYVTLDDEDPPEHGTLDLNEDGSFSYMPDSDFYGQDSFTYMMLGIPAGRVEHELLDKAIVTITILPAGVQYLPLIIR